MNDKYERQMKKGVLDMLVLRLLRSEAKYGYQIIQEMREKRGRGETGTEKILSNHRRGGNGTCRDRECLETDFRWGDKNYGGLTNG